MLVPEIALAPQTVGRFRERFGDTVAVLHSALGQAERRDERDRIARGEARVVVGARSAIFAPIRGLGLIVVDEEHDSSYKQESDPRYDARTVAAKRVAVEGAVALYGSATPRPESWARLERIVLSERIGAPLPRVRIVDLRRESGYPLSAPLLTELGRLAERGGKAILLLNRRGEVPAIHCRACGLSRRCGNCDVALTLHRDGSLHCHHCGYREPVPAACPACGSVELAHIGAGTQRLEKELERNVPELERIRLDADTAARPGALRRRSSASATPTASFSSAPRWSPRGTTSPASTSLRSSMRTPGSRCPTSGRRSGRSSSSPSSPDGAGAMLRGWCSYRRSSPTRCRSSSPSGTTSPASSPRSSSAARCSATRRTAISSRSSPAGPEADPVAQVLREVRAGLDGVEGTILGPAPLLRLRGRHRAQLVAKTAEPRALARRAAALLAAASPTLRRRGLTAVVDVDPQSL